jgi:GNAT superfamily N-acetyltransferase
VPVQRFGCAGEQVGVRMDRIDDSLSLADASAYLLRRRDPHLMHLGAIGYDSVRSIVGLSRAGALAAVILTVDYAGALPDPRPTMMVAADDPATLLKLLRARSWPDRGVWAAGEAPLRDALEDAFGLHHSRMRGLMFYGAELPDHRPVALQPISLRIGQAVLRQLEERDAEQLNLAPCVLSSTALRGWLRQGWRVFGALEGRTLLAHALAAYPIADADEIAAVYTAARARRRGLGAAVVAAVVLDARARGRRAFYVASRTNTPSCQLAERVGLRPIGETWELVIGR